MISFDKLRANDIQRILRVKETPCIGPLRLANPENDGPKLEKLCRDASQNPRILEETLLTTGFGLSSRTDQIPLRLPALLLPALETIRTAKKYGLPPLQYLVYQVTDFIAQTNGIEALAGLTLSAG